MEMNQVPDELSHAPNTHTHTQRVTREEETQGGEKRNTEETLKL